MPFPTIPIADAPHPQAWEGVCARKPWEYQVTAMIPVLNHSECTELCVEILRLQTVRPYIVLVDTGSGAEHLTRHLAMRTEDCEVHSLRFNGVRHPSAPVATALDLAFSQCTTEWAFLTHQDCLLRKRMVLAELIDLARQSPVVGGQFTRRTHNDWHLIVGHTCTLMHVPTVNRIGLAWSLRRLSDLYGIPQQPSPDRPNWPDTEILANYILRGAGITPLMIAVEENYTRNRNEYFDHVRSLPGASAYGNGSPFHKRMRKHWEAAEREARQRIALWKQEPTPPEPPPIAVQYDLDLPGPPCPLPSFSHWYPVAPCSEMTWNSSAESRWAAIHREGSAG